MKPSVFYITLALAISFSIGACSKKSGSSGAKGDKEVSQKKPSKKDPGYTVLPIVVDRNADLSTSDNYTLWQADVEDGYLTTVVNYSGGCKEHKFAMFSNGMWAKSNPPQLNLFLHHNANEDNCRAFIYDTLRFDLTNAIYPGANQVLLKINTPSGKIENILFEYELK
jgi:hypothetical protein